MSLLGSFVVFLCLAQWLTAVGASAWGLAPRATAKASPSPIPVPASLSWDGIDGSWSTFEFQVGTGSAGSQNVRLLASTEGHNILVVRSDACAASDTQCQNNRGGLFAPNESSTWQQYGYYQLSMEETFGINAQGQFGNDTVTLGYQGSGGLMVQDQLVSAFTDNQIYLGLFGLSPTSTQFSTTVSRPSYLTSLKTQNLIPSTAYAYTAGAKYRLKQVYGSLILGGYDTSLFIPNNLNFSMSSISGRELMVGIQSISSMNENGTGAVLLQDGIMATLDSSTALFWLPQVVCQQFERAFGLIRDSKTGLYLVNATLHDKLREQNATVAFTLGRTMEGGDVVNITLPYNSFDLVVQPPAFNVSQSQAYFPLRQAANDTQYTLGRAFLQEAYLIADWDSRSFSVSQCAFIPDAKSNIVAITSRSGTSASGSSSGASSSSSSSKGRTVGIAVGVTLGVLAIIAGLVIFFCLRRRKDRKAAAVAAGSEQDSDTKIREGVPKRELGTGHDNQRYEMEGNNAHVKSPQESPMPSWVDEKARYPGNRSNMVEADHGDSSTPEMAGSSRTHGRPTHEMYDQSSEQPRFELAADQPRELHGSTPGSSMPNSPVASPRRSRGFRSPFGKNTSTPASQPSTPVERRQGQQTPQSISSLLGSIRRKRLSTGPSTPRPPSDQHDNASSNGGDIPVPTSPPSAQHEVLSPVSRRETFERSGTPSSTHDMRSPISSQSQSPSSPHGGVFDRLRRRS